MAEQEAERTEPATPKRKQEARKRGEVAQSRDLSGVVLLTAALLAAMSFGGVAVLTALALQAQAAWAAAAAPPTSLTDFHAALLVYFGAAGKGLLPMGLALLTAGLLAPLLQTGPLFSFDALTPRPNRMDPIKGIQKLVKPEKLVELAKALLKVGIVLAIGWSVLGNALPELTSLPQVGIGDGIVTTGLLARRMAVSILAAMGALALFDLAWQRFQYEKRLRMSKQEVRDESKQAQGSPEVRARFKQRQLELTRARMIADVAEADVVVTNPEHFAVALRYDRASMAAPQVIAKGRNHVAARIRRVAVENDVPIVENPPLARALHRTAEVGQEIPQALFQAVAEVLAYVFRVDSQRGRSWSASP